MSMFFFALAALFALNVIFAAFLYFRPRLRPTSRSRLANWVLRAPAENDAHNRLLAALRD